MKQKPITEKQILQTLTVLPHNKIKLGEYEDSTLSVLWWLYAKLRPNILPSRNVSGLAVDLTSISNVPIHYWEHIALKVVEEAKTGEEAKDIAIREFKKLVHR